MLKIILDEQFDISYYTKGISWADTDNMAIFERKEIYRRLLKRKRDEREAAEEAHKKSASKIKSNNSSSTGRPRKVRR